MIQLLTVTGTRPEAFALCEKWMARQTYNGKAHWIVVDDGEVAQPLGPVPKSWKRTVLRPTQKWQPGINTQCPNMLLGLQYVDHKLPLFIIEDDDYYRPEWLELALRRLNHINLVGQSICRKYSLINWRGNSIATPNKSSLCATGMVGDVTFRFKQLCEEGHKLVDMELWREFAGAQVQGAYVVGIKGMPGRSGIDSGHQPAFGRITNTRRTLLPNWIGDDAKYYDAFHHPRGDGAQHKKGFMRTRR